MSRVEFIYGDCSRPEFSDMFGGWLTEYDGRVFMVDCGVGTGAATLVERLKKRVKRLDYLLLTHIHMDHAGGAAEILKAFPMAKAVVHAKGLRHLVDPARLWAGTREVMGDLADMYGRPEPIDAARLTAHTEAEIAGLKIIETPGHAQHHLSYRLGETMFVGEAGGCPTLIGGRLHARPATAPRYLPEVTLASIDRLLEEPDGPAYFGHTHEMMPLRPALELYKRQLRLWDAVLRRPDSGREPGETLEAWLNRLADVIFREDPNLRPFNSYAPDELWRERYYMKNSIEGFVRFYADQGSALDPGCSASDPQGPGRRAGAGRPGPAARPRQGPEDADQGSALDPGCSASDPQGPGRRADAGRPGPAARPR